MFFISFYMYVFKKIALKSWARFNYFIAQFFRPLTAANTAEFEFVQKVDKTTFIFVIPLTDFPLVLVNPTVLEIFQQHLVAKALVLINPTEVEIFFKTCAEKP